MGEGDFDDDGNGEGDGVGDGGELVFGAFEGVGEDGRLGGDHADDEGEGDFEQFVTDKQGDDDSGKGHEKTRKDDLQTVPARKRGDERIAGTHADPRQEENEADFAQGLVGTVRQRPDNGAGAPHGTEDEGDEQGAAGESKLEGHAAGKRERDGAKRDAHSNTNAEGEAG